MNCKIFRMYCNNTKIECNSLHTESITKCTQHTLKAIAFVELALVSWVRFYALSYRSTRNVIECVQWFRLLKPYCLHYMLCTYLLYIFGFRVEFCFSNEFSILFFGKKCSKNVHESLLNRCVYERTVIQPIL